MVTTKAKWYLYERTTDFISKFADRMLCGDPLICDTHFADREYGHKLIVDFVDPVPDLNFADFGWEESRWTKFCRDYLDARFRPWLEHCKEIPGSAEWGYTFKDAGHRNGNCVLHLSFSINPYPNLTMISRSSMILPTSILELSLANLICEYLRPTYPGITFTWMVNMYYFSSTLGFYYLLYTWWAKNGFVPDSLCGRAFGRMLDRYDLWKAGKYTPKFQRQLRVMMKSAAPRPVDFIPWQLPEYKEEDQIETTTWEDEDADS